MMYLAVEGSYIPREYYIFDDLRLVYMPIFKVASTSIKTALLRPSGTAGSYPAYMDIHKAGTDGHHFLFGQRRSQYFKFAFVRDPFDRLVSCYEDRVRRAVYPPIGRHYFDTSYNHVLVKKLSGQAITADMGFESFVSLILRVPDALADGHFKSQYAWLSRFGSLIPDYVGKIENLAEDWQPIASRYDLPEVPTLNPSNRDALQAYYSKPSLVDAVARRYSKDIRVFGYENSHHDLRRASISTPPSRGVGSPQRKELRSDQRESPHQS